MKDEKKAPKLRFKGFTDDWEQCKLGDVCEEVSGNNGNVKGLPILTISAANGWMNQKDRFSQVIAGNELKKYTLLEKGHLAYNHGNSKLAKYGTVFVQNLYDQALVPRVYHSFKMKTENNPYYVEYYFATKKLDRELARLVTSGARMDGLLNINKKDFFKIKFEVPTPVEQSLISTILQKLDQTITLHEEKKHQLERLKSALLQKMFADKSGYPAVRFEGFSDEWEQCKLSSMTQYKNGKGHEDKQTDSGDFELVNLNSISIDGGFKHSGKFVNESDDEILYKNDLVMILSDVGHGDLLGRVALIPDDNKFILNQRVALLRPNKTVNPEFLFFYINSHQKYFKSQGAGMSQLNISKKSVETFSSLVPNIDEQKKISLFLMKLDSLITLHDQKLSLLKRVKQTLLQKMFI